MTSTKDAMLEAVEDLFPLQMNNWHTHFPPIPNWSRSPGRKIILSGCTDFLGRNILGQLLRQPNISEIYLLVHGTSGSDEHNALDSHQRVETIIQSFGVPPSFSGEVRVYTVSTTERWNKAAYHLLANGLTDIIHAAWPTNRFEIANSFIAHIRGLLEIYNIAALAKRHNPSVRFTFLSSTDAVVCSTQSPIPETISHDPADALLTGYAQSKWIAEQLLYRLSSGFRPHPQPEVRIVRIGELTASTKNPVWKLYEKWPLMFDIGLRQMGGKLPNLDALGFGRLDWLPVNVAARAVLDVALAEGTGDGRVEGEGLSVAHVVNCWPNGKSWKDVQEWLARPGFVNGLRGKAVEIIPGYQWIEGFQAMAGERGKIVEAEDEELPPRNFFEVFRREFGASSETRRNLTFETRRTESQSLMMREGKRQADITKSMLQDILKWLFEEARKFERGSLGSEENSMGESRAVEFTTIG